MNIISFTEKFAICFSEPKTVNAGTISVAYGVQEISLYEKETGRKIPTIFVLQGECLQSDALIQQLYDWHSKQ